MTTSRLALAIGLVLGVVAAFGGLGHLIIVAVFLGLGWAVGLVLEGRLDLRALLGQSMDRR